MQELSLHRGAIFATAFVNTVVVAALVIWMADQHKALVIGLTVGAWVGSWLLVYLWQLFTTPARLEQEAKAKIDALQEGISKRAARRAAVQPLMDLYQRALILGANPQDLDHKTWMIRYDQWKEEVVRALEPLSTVEPWMFKTLGDTNLRGMPETERDKFLVLFQELLSKREKLRKIIARVLPKEDPLQDSLRGEEA
jgi:hypothetical protein